MPKSTAALCNNCAHAWRTTRKEPPFPCPKCKLKLGLPRSLKPSKFKNRRVEVDGITFDSRKEARRWAVLRMMERAGQIRNLQRQVRYPLEVEGVLVCSYVADFRYFEPDPTAPDEFLLIAEDVKGRRTDVYRLKKKLMKAIHGIEVRET